MVCAILAGEICCHQNQVEMGYVSDYETMIKPLMEAVADNEHQHKLCLWMFMVYLLDWFDGLNPL
jgi:hypothetical protein